MSSFLDALFEPEQHCRCGHHEGSHCHGFTNQACMWCECRGFIDPEQAGARSPVATPPGRRIFSHSAP